MTNTAVVNTYVGANPEGVAYDESNGYVYVTNMGADGVSVINRTGPALNGTASVIGMISIGSSPSGVAYDPTNVYIYVANE